MEKLLPDRLKELWARVEQGRLTEAQYCGDHERLLAEYREAWRAAQLLDGYQELERSVLAELGLYFGCDDMDEIRRRCERADAQVEAAWGRTVDPTDRASVERHYDEIEERIFVHMWWHSLVEDDSPLAHVTALRFAQQHGCRRCLDFGAGVGSGGLLFARHGLEVTLAEISSPLLRFSEWRFGLRRLRADFIDLKVARLPTATFDVVTAMDVFEHLFDPAGTLEALWEALRPGGFLFGRFHVEADDHQAGHIVHDFGPLFERMASLGFIEAWQDEWLWGHQVFQRP